MKPITLSATSLIGDKVVNVQGEHLGRIEELMIELATGHVQYAVLSFHAFAGLGGKFFAIPWNALALDLDEKRFVLDADEAFLEAAPGFPKDDWPDFADPAFRERHFSHYEIKLATR